MNWHTGNIAEAVEESKAKNAIFVVYIEGQDEMTANLDRFLNDRRVSSKLESSDFVAVKIHGDSPTYAQFISLYKVVPVPSIFFIGKSGTPLDIATGIVGGVEELVAKIDKVLLLAGKQPHQMANVDSEAASTRTIAGADDSNTTTEEIATTPKPQPEQKVEAVEPVSDHTEQAAAEEDAVPAEEIAGQADTVAKSADEPAAVEPIAVVASAASFKSAAAPKPFVAPQEVAGAEPSAAALSAAAAAEKRAALATAAADSPVIPHPAVSFMPTSAAVGTQSGPRSPAEEAELRMVDIQNLIEQRRHEREEEQKRRDKENELRRRREGREAQAQQAVNREHELKNLQERIRRERQQEQETRERILAQIAADRAELAHRESINAEVQSINTATTTSTITTSANAAEVSISSVDETRLQIRLPGGITRTKAFSATEPLATVRGYVIQELLPGSNIREFTLATSYPRREFKAEDETKTLNDLNLVPNAVLLVLKSEQVNSVVRSRNNLVNIVTSMIWAILTPAAVAFDYINRIGFQRLRQRVMQLVSNVGWAKPADRTNSQGDVIPNDAYTRRNLDMFMLGSRAGSGMQPTPTPINAVGSGTDQVKPVKLSEDGLDAPQPSELGQQRSRGFKPTRYGETNIRRLADTLKDDDEDKATYNGNSTQQQ